MKLATFYLCCKFMAVVGLSPLIALPAASAADITVKPLGDITATSTENDAIWKQITICSSSNGYSISPISSALEGKPASFYRDAPADDHKIVLLRRTLLGETEFDINTFSRGKWYSSQSDSNLITLGDTESFKLIYEQTDSSIYTYQFRLDDKGNGHLMWSQHYLLFGRVSAYYSDCQNPNY